MQSPFEKIACELDYPMIVVTVAAGDDRDGCLVGFSTQCSIDPARYAVFVSKKNRTAEIAARTDTMIVHILRQGDQATARLFGEETGDEVAKFEHVRWHEGPSATPVLDGVDWFAGRVRDRIDVGDHVLHLLDVAGEGDARFAGARQLGFQAVRGLVAGHAP
jgi:flavin reductase (DIM6/NTAB) family NADH-FMN oxidoreductase RutF